MTMRFKYCGIVCALLVGVLSSAPLVKGQERRTAGDEAQVRAIANRFFEFARNRDLTGLMSLWSAASPEKEAVRRRFESIFTHGGSFQVEGVTLEKIDWDGDKAAVTLSGEFVVLARGGVKPTRAPGRGFRVCRLAKERGTWKIWSYETNSFGFAARLAVEQDETRRAILDANADLVSIYLEKTLFLEGFNLSKKSESARAIEVLNLAKEVAEEVDDKPGMASVLVTIASVQSSIGDYRAAGINLEKSLEIRKSLENPAGGRVALGNLYAIANTLYSQRRYSEAKEYYEKTLRIADETGEKWLHASALYGLGNIEYVQGNYDVAIKLYETALKANEALGNKSNVALCLEVIGNIRNAQTDYAGALASYERALQIKEGFGGKRTTADLLVSMGNIYSAEGDYERASAKYDEALKINNENKDKVGLAKALVRIGNTSTEQGDYG